ncbi:MAG: copper homeostasis protein CutC, partial [Clostridia bacterium]|nr:copper homeostasis protein CutC [Clostridia bacterium]
ALADAEALLERGADGLVFGFLKADGSLDVERTRRLARMAGDKTKVFHRAIDVAADWRQMLEQLIEIGIDRVLTSGQAPDVYYGIDVIREMMDFAQGAIQILPGAGVNLKNVDRIIEYTGCDQIHVARFRQYTDPSTANNRDIFYGGALYPPEDRYDVIDGDYVAEIRKHL